VRSENQLKAAEIELLLEKAYQMLDYDIVYVPVLSIQKRTDFILQHL